MSIRKYKNDLEVILHNDEIELIGLNETRLNGKFINERMGLDG